MSRLARAMKCRPSTFPTPRLPEWSITQTWSASSRQTSMKWLPPPSVPSCRGHFSRTFRSIFPMRGWRRHVQDPLDARPQRVEHLRRRRPAAGGRRSRRGRRPRSPASHRAQRVGQPRRVERQPRRAHPAADVDADRGRDQRPPRRNHGPDGGPDPEVHVGHRGHVAHHDRQPRDGAELLQRRLVDVVREDLDRNAAPVEHLPHRHGLRFLRADGEPVDEVLPLRR